MSNSAPKHRAPVEDTPKASRRARARLKRRWPRRTLFVANGLVLACIAATATAYAYVQHELNSIAIGPSRKVICEGCYAGGGGKLPKSDVIQADGLQSENILLIGNETRQGLTPQQQQQYGSSLIYSGTLADIIMILHLDPATDTASILSIPRDLFAPMPLNSPVGPFQKIDAALNDGAEGPDNLVAAIEQDFGIPINHFVELNFNGFINSVNALGGINVYFPEPVYDAESLLNITTPGCKHLNGVEALALVRARHLQYDPPGDTEPKYDWPQEAESDLARIGRTHTFMKIVSDTAIHEGKTDPIEAVSFVNAILKQITIDKGLKGEILKLVKHYGTLNPATVPETTFPTSDYPDTYYYGDANIGDVLFPVQPDANKVIQAWDPQAFPKAVAPKSVSVVSLAGDYYSAEEGGQALSSHGLHVTSETAGEVPASTTGTFVVYPSGGLAHALYVMKYLSGSVMLEESSSVPAGTVEVDLGSVTNVSAKPTTTTAATTTTGEAATTTGEAATTLPATTTTSAASTTTTAARTPSAHPAATTTTVPTPDGMVVNKSADQTEPWDPRACPS